MKRMITSYCTLLCVVWLCVACGNQSKSATATVENTSPQVEAEVRFTPAMPPAMMPEEQHQAYMVEHYWDTFDFSDTTFLAKVDQQQMLLSYVVYVAGYMTDSQAASAMSRLMQRASTSRRMFDYFLSMAEFVLHDPNSQYRSDEKYIPVLEAVLASPYYDEHERLPYQYDLQIAQQNRIGRKANDFTYTLASGRSDRMSNIKSDYLLIFISNPGCEMCRAVREQILSSPMLNTLIEQRRLKILVIYPDEDLALWREHSDDYPESWINAYDKGMTITNQRLYDLKAIPALYLLDSEKRVMAKDCTDVEQIERLIKQAEE